MFEWGMLHTRGSTDEMFKAHHLNESCVIGSWRTYSVSCHMYAWVMSQADSSIDVAWGAHDFNDLCVCDSCHTYSVPCHTYRWVMSHTGSYIERRCGHTIWFMSHVQWVMSYVWFSHMTCRYAIKVMFGAHGVHESCVCESCHTFSAYCYTYEWVMSHAGSYIDEMLGTHDLIQSPHPQVIQHISHIITILCTNLNSLSYYLFYYSLHITHDPYWFLVIPFSTCNISS